MRSIPGALRVRRTVVAALSGAALIGGLVAPATAASPALALSAAEAPTPVLGGFAVGDGLEATISEADGALGLVLPLAGLGLAWDSRRSGSNRYGLGDGWAWHTGTIDTSGGVRAFPSSGGVFEMDASQPSGLAGYPAHDVVFEASGGVLPARAEAADATDAPLLTASPGPRP
jgi:hypothetical protein